MQMAGFRDKNGVEWQVEPTVTTCRRLRDRVKNAIDVLDPQSLAKAFDHPFDRFDMLWAFCESQALARNITVDEFDVAIATEEASAEANRALRKSLTDFFLRMGMESLAAVITETVAARERLDRLAVTKIKGDRRKQLFEKAVAKADAEMDGLLDEAEAKLDKISSKPSQQTDGLKSTSSPESSE
jgi:hypothetical protein